MFDRTEWDKQCARIAAHAQTVGLELWRMFRDCRRVAVTSATIGNEFDTYNPTMFGGVYINGRECSTVHSPYYRFDLPMGANAVDGVVVYTLEQYGVVNDIALRPVPLEWREIMSLPDHVLAANIHVSVVADNPVVVYNNAFTALNGVDTLAALRAEGIHIGYTAASSLDLSLPLM